jgi:hypothetical protein
MKSSVASVISSAACRVRVAFYAAGFEKSHKRRRLLPARSPQTRSTLRVEARSTTGQHWVRRYRIGLLGIQDANRLPREAPNSTWKRVCYLSLLKTARYVWSRGGFSPS